MIREMEEHLQRMSRGWRIGLALLGFFASLVLAVFCVITTSFVLGLCASVALLASLLLWPGKVFRSRRPLRIDDNE